MGGANQLKSQNNNELHTYHTTSPTEKGAENDTARTDIKIHRQAREHHPDAGIQGFEHNQTFDEDRRTRERWMAVQPRNAIEKTKRAGKKVHEVHNEVEA